MDRPRLPARQAWDGGEDRLVPLFPELLPYLREAFEQAEPGSDFVIARHYAGDAESRKTHAEKPGGGVNWRTQFERIIQRAGLKPWPKLFQNLRSTRETELAERWPEHVVCKWIGNSRMVARKHYLQVTDEHYEQAAMPKGTTAQSAAQNQAQYPAGTVFPDVQIALAEQQQSPEIPGLADRNALLHDDLVGDTGQEHPPDGVIWSHCEPSLDMASEERILAEFEARRTEKRDAMSCVHKYTDVP